MEDWAEIRRLHRAEGVAIKEIVRRLGVARNTVRKALASDAPPRYAGGGRGSAADAVEPAIRALLAEHPRMPATVIAERIAWTRSMTTLKDKVRAIRPDYARADPADRLEHAPGRAAQCDLWFPAVAIPLTGGQVAGPSGLGGLVKLPVLTMTWAYSRFITAALLPSRQGGDLLAGMWQLLATVGGAPAELVWDREAAIGGTGRVSDPVAAFAGSLGVRVRLCPPRDPESKGIVERTNGFLETSFLPGRVFTSPSDFNAQLAGWLPAANARLVRATGARPREALAADLAAGVALPAAAPAVGIRSRVRLGRDYYVRVDGNDYSVHPSAIGRFVDIVATPTRVVVTCPGLPTTSSAGSSAGSGGGALVVADHERCWARRQVIRDPAHVAAAKALRGAHTSDREQRERAAREATRAAASQRRWQADGTEVQLRALSDYDVLFGLREQADERVGREHLQVVR